jgi:hypothetical protein
LEAIRLSTIFHNEPLFANVSQVFETVAEATDLTNEIVSLTRADMFLPFSDFDRVNEFVESRQRYYFHDQSRYPMYFHEPASVLSDELKIVRKDTGSTTKFIERNIKEWVKVSTNKRTGFPVSGRDSSMLAAHSGSICRSLSIVGSAGSRTLFLGNP